MTNVPDRYTVKDDQQNILGSRQTKKEAVKACRAIANRWCNFHIYVVDNRNGEIVFSFSK